MTSISGTRPESEALTPSYSLGGLKMRPFLVALALLSWLSAGCRKQEAAKALIETPPAQLSPDIPSEIMGRWRIVDWDTCGVVSMVDDQPNRYIGKTAMIEPGRMALMDDAGVILKDRLGELGHVGDEHDELLCRFTNVKVSSKDTEEYLTQLTGCGPGNPVFDSFIKKFGSKKIKVFRPEPECPSTGFYDLFMPNPDTLVMDKREIFFFMKRADGVGEAGGARSGT